MRLAALATGLFMAFTAAVAAQPYAAPEDLIAAIYEPYFGGAFPEDESAQRSMALQALYDRDQEITPEGEIGAIDFDPYVDGQDYEITDLVIGTPDISGDRAIVDVTFKNFGEPRALTYDLVFEDGGWKVDDLASTLGDYPYRLTEIFAMAAGGQ
ncbi:DUF3828 domain-containing protein [Devosia aquimaris]|uniref:DUF3828 domain-containing protein n=1 Tax=Devosia aquimaris TaxID=2866214 RepID=UPI001CD12504|nr:DUF3828 domain-containing protein [Devosia sp. CJK-A8-3]